MEKLDQPYIVPEDILTHEQKVLRSRGLFFVGGNYFDNEKGIRQYKYGQMYVEIYVPQEITRPYPLVFYHGGGQSGLCWMATADGHEGWVYSFLKKGYVVYVVDVPARGRSAYHIDVDGPLSRLSSELCKQYFADSIGNWKTANLHTQWPTAEFNEKGYDKNFDNLCSAMVDQVNVVRQQEAVQEASKALLNRIGPSIIVTHSLSGPYRWVIADVCSGLVEGIISMEPSGPPFAGISITAGKQRPYGIADIPLKFDPPLNPPKWRREENIIPPKVEDTQSWLQLEPAGQLVNLAGVPVLMVTAEASYHSPFDHLTSAFLKQAGVDVEFAPLGERGIHGNGHMMMLEKNNEVIAEFIHRWVLDNI